MNDRTKSQRPVPPVHVAAAHLLGRALAKVLCAVVLLLVVVIEAHAQETAPSRDSAGNTYGLRSMNASPELDAFAFFIGKWEGTSKTRLPDGKVVEYPLTWIWRYILDGTAIADEGHAKAPDGTHAVGISFRQYDSSRKAWVIEFLVEPQSLFFPQVRPGVGSVTVNGRNVTVFNGGRPERPSWRVREHYLPAPDNDGWVYRLDESNDGGTSWNEGRTEITLRRSK